MASPSRVYAVLLCPTLCLLLSAGADLNSVDHNLPTTKYRAGFFAGLQPQDSESREVRTLDGIWQFRAAPKDDPDVGFREEWYRSPLDSSGDVIDMPVPSSYNDITENVTLRDHVGWVWYSTTTFVPKSWQGSRTVLRVGSAHYTARVFVNGQFVAGHSGGHLPFAADVSKYLRQGQRNLISIAVNNLLTNVTIPQGRLVHSKSTKNYVYPVNDTVLQYNFDFFNYAGIHRPVVLYTTPHVYIEDVLVKVNLQEDGSAVVQYTVVVDAPVVKVSLEDPSGEQVTSTDGRLGRFLLKSPQLWWPYLMDPSPGKRYTLVVKATSDGVADVYRQKFGIRELTWDDTGVRINGRNIYIRGFGKHEDSDIRGKGLDLPLVVKDFNLIEWVGANCFRTSHYPYAEEIMEAADSRGIMVINETPAVSLDYSGTKSDPSLLDHHLQVLEEMVGRDKNRPSVIMWSLSNEARTSQHAAVDYYRRLVERLRQLDSSRPVTAVLNTFPDTELVAPLLDVVCVNRYFSWYSDTGRVELVQQQAQHFFTYWHSTFGKPVINSEYGADTVPGLHRQPSFIFTEEYQVQLMAENFKAFESLRAQGWFIGEMIWNFADFMTKQQVNRVVGNKKGIFTRQRQPKLSAHLLRSRYWGLARLHDNHHLNLPSDLMFSSGYTGLNNHSSCVM